MVLFGRVNFYMFIINLSGYEDIIQQKNVYIRLEFRKEVWGQRYSLELLVFRGYQMKLFGKSIDREVKRMKDKVWGYFNVWKCGRGSRENKGENKKRILIRND